MKPLDIAISGLHLHSFLMFISGCWEPVSAHFYEIRNIVATTM